MLPALQIVTAALKRLYGMESVAKYSRPEKMGRCGALGAGYCMETTDLLSLSETATSSTAGLVIITFSSDKIA
jgi:hypothetical protein